MIDHHQAEFNSDLVMTRFTDKNCESNLNEIKFSLKSWIERFGEEGVIVMLYQYPTTKGFCVRAFCRTDNTKPNINHLMRYINVHDDLAMRPVKGWKAWSTLFSEDNYPKNSYHMTFDPVEFGHLIAQRIQRIDTLIKGT